MLKLDIGLQMLNSWVWEAGGWWLTGLRSDLNPCGGTCLHLVVSSKSGNAPLAAVSPETRKSDEEMVLASFPYLFLLRSRLF